MSSLADATFAFAGAADAARPSRSTVAAAVRNPPRDAVKSAMGRMPK